MKTSIRLSAFTAVVLAAMPALAQAPPSNTIKAVLEKGAVFTIQGQDYDFVAKSDGTYTDKAGEVVGRYRADGQKLCVTPTTFGQEICFTYPDGKTSGDKFEVAGEMGAATVTIR